MNKLTDLEIASIAIAVRESITRSWHQPDWNYMYYNEFQRAVETGIRMALEKQAAKDHAAGGPG